MGRHGCLQAYGWGWELGDLEGEPLVTSSGGQPGMQTVAALLPEKGLGVIVLGNLQGGNAPYVVGDLAFWALDKLVKKRRIDHGRSSRLGRSHPRGLAFASTCITLRQSKKAHIGGSTATAKSLPGAATVHSTASTAPSTARPR